MSTVRPIKLNNKHMKISGKLLLLALTLVISSGITKADVLEPVKWNTSYEKVDGNSYNIVFKAVIDKGWHLYGLNIPEGGPIATSFNFEESTAYELIGHPSSSVKPEKIFDNTFEMELELFDHAVVFKQKIKLNSPSVTLGGYIEFMACDDSRCLPPSEIEFSFKIEGTTTANASKEVEKTPTPVFSTKKLDIDIVPEETTKENTVEEEQPQATTQAENTTKNASDEENKPLWLIFILAIGGGLAAVLTPCVYPIIPLTVSFFSSGAPTKSQSISKAMAFGISLIAIYTAVGLISGIFQIDLMKEITSHWIPNLIFFILFIVFAASFFGAFEITLPNKWANSIDQKADKGGFIGSFFMALATAVVSFSCTGLIAGVVLGYAMQGDIIKPVVGMAGFGLGFAAPFTLLAMFPNVTKNLPKSGGWLNAIKVVFAFLMLLFSLVFLGMLGADIISRDFILAAAIAILFLLGLYLIGKIKFSHDSDLLHVSVPRLLLAIVSWTFAIYLITGMFGAPLKKLSSFLPPAHTLGINLNTKNYVQVTSSENETTCSETPKWSKELHLPHGLKGYFDWNEALACAKEQNKPILVDFVGHSCKNCKKMYAEVISDEKVLQIITKEYIMLAMYTDDRTKLPEDEWVTSTLDKRIKKTLGKKNLDFQVSKYQSNALPMYVIVDPQGEILTKSKKYYTYSSDVNSFLEFLEEGINNFKK